MNDLSVYGQESNPATWRLCKMNLAIRGIKGNISSRHADTFHEDLHKGLKAEFVLANPPFNVSDWGGEYLRDDPRWKFGTPPTNNANFAWVQHIVHHLSPSGVAGFVLSNGSLAANQGRVEGKIRTALIENDLIDCIVALPSQLFYNTQIAASLWFIARDKEDSKFRNRRGETLSSTPTTPVTWWAAFTVSLSTKRSRVSPAPTTHGVTKSMNMCIRTHLVFASPPP